MKTPGFWYRPEATPAARLLAPAGALYDLAAARADVKGLWLQPGGEVIPERATKA